MPELRRMTALGSRAELTRPGGEIGGMATSDSGTQLPPPRPAPWLERAAGAFAVAGGVLMLAVAALVTTSVVLRWQFNAPIDGDFEYVRMGTAVAVFAFLPYAQVRRGNIMVDTFTSWLPARGQAFIDAFWDLAYALFMGFIAYCLVFGTWDAIRSGETTMQRQIVLWPSIAIATGLCMLLTVTAVATAIRLVTHRAPAPGPTP
jgi:TRAP-type C4-dicarboxylate transport system permease small subunit